MPRFPDASQGWSGFGGWGEGFRLNGRGSAGSEIVARSFNSDIHDIVLTWSYEVERDGDTYLIHYTDLIISAVGRMLASRGLDYTFLPSPPTRGVVRGPQQNTAPPQPTPCPPPSPGMGDINVNWIPPTILGYTGGVQLDHNNAYPYGGLTAGTPNLPFTGFLGGSIMGGNGTVSPGLNFSVSGGFLVGASYSGKLDRTSLKSILKSFLRNGSWSFGGITPGASVSVYYVRHPTNVNGRCK